jgi:peptidoglycan hydrolase CwlO-like protein
VKKMTLPVAVGVAIIGCVLAVSANVTASKMTADLQREQYQRLVTEQQLQKANDMIKRLEFDLASANRKISSIEEIINSETSETNMLQSQLDIVTKERNVLQQQIEEFKKQVAGTAGESSLNP